jgi:hypothetical protein
LKPQSWKMPWTQGNENDIKKPKTLIFKDKYFIWHEWRMGGKNKSHWFVVAEREKKRARGRGLSVAPFFCFVTCLSYLAMWSSTKHQKMVKCVYYKM